MYYVYVLKSEKNGDLYVGSTENVANRLIMHNKGKVCSTKPNRPWKIMTSVTFQTRGEAVKHETFLKTGQQKELLRKKFVTP